MVFQLQKGPTRIPALTEECSSSVKASSKLIVLEGSTDHTHSVHACQMCSPWLPDEDIVILP